MLSNGGFTFEMRAAIDACACDSRAPEALEAVILGALAEREAAVLRVAQEERAAMLQAAETAMIRAVQEEREAVLQALAEREVEMSAIDA